MDKRYQVFISSTFSDLMEERSKVMHAIMSLDCIPAGMELFPSADEEQFNFIKKIIDDCDYYLVVIGGRYGTLSEDGIGYTEMEFDYAISKGIKVLAFLHKNLEDIPVGKSDIEPEKREKLLAFRQKVSTGRLVKFWNNADELAGQVALSLNQTIKMYPAVGWVRANLVSSAESLQEMNELRKQLAELQEYKSTIEKVSLLKETNFSKELAGLDDKIILNGTSKRWSNYQNSYVYENWTINISWRDLFAIIAPFFLDNPNDARAKAIIEKELFKLAKPGSSYDPTIDEQDFQTIKIQLKALNLFNIEYSNTIQGGASLFWILTDLGKELMMQTRSVKKVTI
jgi:hypothetical protein